MGKLRDWVKFNPYARASVFLLQNVLQSVLPSQVTANSEPVLYEQAIMVRMRGEDEFAREWVAHHISMGFGHVFIYDNDDHDALSARLGDFVQAGLVTIIRWAVRPASPSCYFHFFAHYLTMCRWVAFIDADEFIWEAKRGELSRVLARMPAPALALNWRYFGSSGHRSIPEGLVIANFVSCDAELDSHVKVIVRSSAVRRYRNPHGFYYARGALARSVSGARVFGSVVAPPAEPPLELWHYVYRSMEDYSNKLQRGYSTTQGVRDLGRRESRLLSEFHEHNAETRTFDPSHIAVVRELVVGGPGGPVSDGAS